MNKRQERLMPNGNPRYVHVYDNKGRTADRFTVVFTRTGRTGSNRDKKQNNGHMYVTMSLSPTHPQGVCQHGSSHKPIDWPTYGHLGRKIKFEDLPLSCQNVVRKDYMKIWGLK